MHVKQILLWHVRCYEIGVYTVEISSVSLCANMLIFCQICNLFLFLYLTELGICTEETVFITTMQTSSY